MHAIFPVLTITHTLEQTAMQKPATDVTDLLTLDLVGAVDGGHVDEVLQDGGVGSDSNAGSHQDGHLVLVPVLLTRPVRPVQIELWTPHTKQYCYCLLILKSNAQTRGISPLHRLTGKAKYKSHTRLIAGKSE